MPLQYFLQSDTLSWSEEIVNSDYPCERWFKTSLRPAVRVHKIRDTRNNVATDGKYVRYYCGGTEYTWSGSGDHFVSHTINFTGTDTAVRASVHEFEYAHLTIKNNGNNAGWDIGVTNNNYVLVTVEYNTKMCYLEDARTWTKLNDISTFTLGGEESATKNVAKPESLT